MQVSLVIPAMAAFTLWDTLVQYLACLNFKNNVISHSRYEFYHVHCTELISMPWSTSEKVLHCQKYWIAFCICYWSYFTPVVKEVDRPARETMFLLNPGDFSLSWMFLSPRASLCQKSADTAIFFRLNSQVRIFTISNLGALTFIEFESSIFVRPSTVRDEIFS